MRLVVIILAKEDDTKLKKAVESVQFSDEVIVVKERIQVSDFSEIRNKALDQAKGEWAMFVDSDEEVSQQLANEIKRVIKFSNNGYFFRRQDKFLGKWLKYGETTSVKLLRLAKRDAGRWVRPVHEVWKVKGKIGELKNLLLHYSHDSIEEMVGKLDRYSGMEAGYKNKQIAKYTNRQMDKWINLVQMFIFPTAKFVQNYIFRLGCLDGMEGFIHAGMMSGHSFLVRAKMLVKKQETENRKQ